MDTVSTQHNALAIPELIYTIATFLQSAKDLLNYRLSCSDFNRFSQSSEQREADEFRMKFITPAIADWGTTKRTFGVLPNGWFHGPSSTISRLNSETYTETTEFFVDNKLHGEHVTLQYKGEAAPLLLKRMYFIYGIVDGVYEAYHSSGSKSQHCVYSQGALVGEYFTWHENGQVAIRRVYENGKEMGVSEEFSSDGQLLARAPHDEQGRLHGMLEKWERYDTSTRLISSCPYVHGAQHGQDETFWRGQLEYTAPFENGRRHGEEKRFWCDGTLMDVSHYNQGKLHGDCIQYYRDGTIASHYVYENGVRTVTIADDQPPARIITVFPSSYRMVGGVKHILRPKEWAADIYARYK